MLSPRLTQETRLELTTLWCDESYIIVPVYVIALSFIINNQFFVVCTALL